jgi:hypothetical protein
MPAFFMPAEPILIKCLINIGSGNVLFPLGLAFL